MEYGAYGLHQLLVDELANYINSQYFSKSPLILEASAHELKKENNLYKAPYIESSPAYLTDPKGISGSKILPDFLKDYFNELSQANLGVYKEPFCHQIQALEGFYLGQDLFVSTGTGSGKTECFLWPIMAKIALEARANALHWNQKGVRCIIMYPMNALVSDQLSRLRRLMGDSEGKFEQIFAQTTNKARRPTFAMYTGRTPYPGLPDQDQNKKLAQTYRTLLNRPSQLAKDNSHLDSAQDQNYLEHLQKEGRLPAKHNMHDFIYKLENGIYTPSKNDAELLTRFEIQRHTPDILITNYSMLEYMLMRPLEQSIWDDTKAYLQQDESHKLLFVMDEAHMYRGSSGGEVAMLIRRLLYKLNIDRSKVQFILTTASMPNNKGDDDIIFEFARNLSAADKSHNFTLLRGTRQELKSDHLIDLDKSKLTQCNIQDFESDNNTRLAALNNFWTGQPSIGINPWPFDDYDQACLWLYHNLFNYREFNKLASLCRGHAVSLISLAEKIFAQENKVDSKRAQKYISILLAIAPLARNEQKSVLFPARMHLLFRGIKGVYACTNKLCTNKNHEQQHDYNLGHIFLSDQHKFCPYCHGLVHELVRDLRCGALFIKGYVFKKRFDNRFDKKEQTGIYLWQHKSFINANDLYEIYLYLPTSDNSHLEKDVEPCYLHTTSGYLYFKDDDDDDTEFDENYLTLYYYYNRNKNDQTTKNSNVISFIRCPKCSHLLSQNSLTSFSTKGNNSFFNLIKSQFRAQPPVAGKTLDEQGENVLFPNEGRKVLLFSDSRQRAAKLARDMSMTSDDTVCRQIMALALKHMAYINNLRASESTDLEDVDFLTLNEVYHFFVLYVAFNKVAIFQAASPLELGAFKDHCVKVLESAKQQLKEQQHAHNDDTHDRFANSCFNLYFSSSPEDGSDQPQPSEKLTLEKLQALTFDNTTLLTVDDAPNQFKEQLLKFYCLSTNNLYDSAISYLVPTPRLVLKCLEDFGNLLKNRHQQALLQKLIDPTNDPLFKQATNQNEQKAAFSTISSNWFVSIFNAWVQKICVDHFALSPNFDPQIRLNLHSYNENFGINPEKIISLKDKAFAHFKLNKEEQFNLSIILSEVLQNNFLLKSSINDANNNYYLDLRTIVPCIDVATTSNSRTTLDDSKSNKAFPDYNHHWYRCNQCSQISPFLLKNNCPNCASNDIKIMDVADMNALSFWRNPIIDAIEGQPVYLIDTQEHTAQLSYKDQRDDLWSKTERYELRFQDFLDKDETPVDILSCTTTMEVGVDIGSLVAVGLRNIPPMRENYQQRAGRAGRRGSSLSTIVTFCEYGPHDSLYFNNPEPMFSGDPRSPWVDINSSKIVERHLHLVMIEQFISYLDNTLANSQKLELFTSEKDQQFNNLSLDKFSTDIFVNSYLPELDNFIVNKFDCAPILAPNLNEIDLEEIRANLLKALNELKAKVNAHPELYVNKFFKYITKKSLLDALYEEGIIPTYSFPKNVVSTYICDNSGKIQYEVSRGLDIAISEYAPGRSIVVDKNTYKIGGLFNPSAQTTYKKDIASAYIEDANYKKELFKCKACGWFGLELNSHNCCPFCNSTAISEINPMLKPWGFAPVNGTSSSTYTIQEDYSYAHKPQYSTLPNAQDMEPLENCHHISVANRENQNIIMLNEGPNNNGFEICTKCGAAQPVDKNNNKGRKDKIKQPYINKRGSACRHDFQVFNLGYDFVTDMLVWQFTLADKIFDTAIWVHRAAQSLAETIRLSASKILDIEFDELLTGYRLRHTQDTYFVDIFIYDNLSSGAGYTLQINLLMSELFDECRRILEGCHCHSACYNCIKHYKNQYEHALLDRFAALDLLNYGQHGTIRSTIAVSEQRTLLKPFEHLFNNDHYYYDSQNMAITIKAKHRSFRIEVFPSLLKAPITQNFKLATLDYDKIYLSELDLKHNLPQAHANTLKVLNKFSM